MRLLFVASEIFPLAKTGGLADVCASLPPAIARLGVDVRLLMPAYAQAWESVVAPQVVADLGEVLPGAPVRLITGWTPDSGLPIWLIDCPVLFQRPGTLYQDPDGRDWPDNALRFGVLCHVAARIALGQASLGWLPDVVHAHDWHTGLVPLLLRLAGDRRPRTVFTVHNAAFQGNFPLDYATQLGLPHEVVAPDGAEFYGQLSFLKAGIRYADKVTTVSPTYAREIRTPEFGFGLEGLFEARSEDLVGIMNGIDAALWNPATDPHLSCRYSSDDAHGKRTCKSALQQQLGLDVDPLAPLVACISRLTQQKMADVLFKHLPDMMERHPRLQFALHGRGEPTLEEGFARLARRYQGRVSVRIGYEESHAHHLHAGADILLHGSRFEPCGLTQLYAMRYGTIPIVSRVGGLADSVIDAGTRISDVPDATGFVFDEPTGEAMHSALSRCLNMYQTRPRIWSALRKRAMSVDFGWVLSARKYAHTYAQLAPEFTLPPFAALLPADMGMPAQRGCRAVPPHRPPVVMHTGQYLAIQSST
ncbi:MAG TPA: glycogen synthase GlgA [Rhodanobacter sp.]|nr:glycogen synthase GlgA [Rhodanobacter sp.]